MVVTDLLVPTVKEVAALMCGVAADTSWKRGKRSFMVTNKDIFGIRLMVRHKGSIMAINTPTWRIAIDIVTSALGTAHPDSVLVKLPIYMSGPTYVNRYRKRIPDPTRFKPADTVTDRLVSKTMHYDVQDKEIFERDWTLLRLFSSEWAEYGT